MSVEHGEKRKRVVFWIILILSICTMLFAGYKLWEGRQVYLEGEQNYKQLADNVKLADLPVSHAENAAGAEPDVQIPGMAIDFDKLREVNPDAVAWLYCPDTAIDYPVMKATDYSYYLDHLPDGTVNANGALFIDYNCAPDFSDSLTVVYGHHMKSGKMFGCLVGYKKQEYYEQHPYMYLYTAQGNYRVDLLYGCVIGAGEWRERAFMFEANLNALLSYADHNTTFESGTRYAEEGGRVIALSTCSYEFDDARYFVLGLLQPEYGG